MAAVYLICGRLCSGKSTYAAALRERRSAAVLSVDEIMLAVFGQDAGALHDTYTARIKAYLLEKSLELLHAGVDVILDWGFWTRRERDETRVFYSAHGIAAELHYLDIPQEEWQRRIEKRNRAVLAGGTGAYLVDGGLRAKFESIFEPPAPDEITRSVGTEK